MTRKQKIGFVIAGIIGIAVIVIFIGLIVEGKIIASVGSIAIGIILARIDDAITDYNGLNGEKSKDATNGMSWW